MGIRATNMSRIVKECRDTCKKEILMERKPYVGITGFDHQSQPQQILLEIPAMSDRYFMAGVLASDKSLQGLPTKHPHRYPRVADIGNIFIDSTALNLIHYHTDTPVAASLLSQMLRIRRYGLSHCHGLQLNVTWPARAALHAYKHRFPDDVLVLQCGKEALAEVGLYSGKIRKPLALVALTDRIASYGDSVDYVLLDTSGGENQLVDVPLMRACLTALYERNVYPLLGFAGGLTIETLRYIALTGLFSEFPDVSIDAEGGLRDEHDCFDMTKAISYYRTAHFYLSV